LRSKITNSNDLIALEDLYLPIKKKRKTKADAAREAGLEPLARILMAQKDNSIESSSRRFLSSDIRTVEDALEGAKYIVAEWINEDQNVRAKIRQLYQRTAKISAKIIKKEASSEKAQKFKQYFDWNEPLKRIPSHRFLAVHRAEKEGILKLKIEIDQKEAYNIISRIILKNRENATTRYVSEAIEDAYKRLLKPSFSTEFLNEAKARADAEAISVFADNLEQLLLAPTLNGKRIMEAHENYNRQHQNIRTENGIKYGDVVEGVNFDYAAKMTAVNAINMAAIAWAPPAPKDVEIGGIVEPSTKLRWKQVDGEIAGYKIYWRDTISPIWQYSRFVGDVSEFTLEGIVIDNFFFGVAAVDKEGHESLVVFPSGTYR